MSRENFNYPVQAGVNESVKAKVSIVQFDDGYEQRRKMGIKNIKRTFSVKFVGVYFEKNGRIELEESVLAVISFLERHAGYKAFDWSSYLYPGNTPVKVYCEEWQPVYNKGTVEISMTFKETM